MMRSFIFRFYAYLALSSCLVGSASSTQHKLNTIEDVLAEPKGGLVDAGADVGSTTNEALFSLPTVFNGVQVPPMKELTGGAFDIETKDGYWYVPLVDHFYLPQQEPSNIKSHLTLFV
jgi:hypothetical protein